MSSKSEIFRPMVQIPKIEECQRILCVQPHPDDTDIGAGATIAKLVRLGAEVIYLTVTDDSAGTQDPALGLDKLAAIRRQEQEAAARELGVKEVRWLGYPDAGDYSSYSVRLDIIRAIRELRPDLLMTVDPYLPYESHPDHLICGQAAAAAVLLYNFVNIKSDPAIDVSFRPYPIRGIAYYHTAYPNTYVEVSQRDWDRKFAAIACHKSQIDEATMERFSIYFDLKAREYGAKAGCERAEAFKVLAPIMLHCVVDAIHI